MLGVLVAAPALLLPHAGDRLSRRAALLGGAAALTVTLPNSPARAVELPTYDEEGKVINKAGYEEETGFRSVSGKDDASSSVQLLASWKWEPSGELVDPVQGSTATVLQFSAEASELQGIKDLGKPENVNLVKALGLAWGWGRADPRTETLRPQYDRCLRTSLTRCHGKACCTLRSWQAQPPWQSHCRRSTALRPRLPQAHSQRLRTAACMSAWSGLRVELGGGSGTGAAAPRGRRGSRSPLWRRSGRWHTAARSMPVRTPGAAPRSAY